MKKFKVFVETVLFSTVIVDASDAEEARYEAEDTVYYDNKKDYPNLSFGTPVARGVELMKEEELPIVSTPKKRARKKKDDN